jgi:hypothetical protein
MDIGEIISDAVKYPSSEWKKVIILGILFILSFVIIGIFFVLGYFLRILKSTIAGIDELPEFDDWGDMFVDGLKVMVVYIIYLLIPGIVIVAGAFSSLASLSVTNTSLSTAPSSFFAIIGITAIIGYILALIFALFAYMALANMALYDEIEAAFRFGEIIDKIKMIGWGKYILWYIVMWVIALIIGFITGLLNVIPIVGTIIAILVIYPYFVMILARSIGLIFESSEEDQKTTLETESIE